MTQKQMVLDYMRQHDGITAWEAFSRLGVGRLSARIRDLRDDGYKIISCRCQGVNRHGKKVCYDRYRVVE